MVSRSYSNKDDPKKHWPETQGTVTSAKIEMSPSSGKGGGKYYWAEFKYKYQVSDQGYRGRFRIEPFPKTGTKNEALRYVAEHEIGSTLVVRYNPDKPYQHATEFDKYDYTSQEIMMAVVYIAIFIIIITIYSLVK